MITPTCPFCGCAQQGTVNFPITYKCGTEIWIVPSQPANHEYQSELCKLKAAVKKVLQHPFPHDLFAIRRQVRDEFSGSDEDAQEALKAGGTEAWCSEEYCVNEYLKHKEAMDELRKLVE
jgi:hypothetical protein